MADGRRNRRAAPWRKAAGLMMGGVLALLGCGRLGVYADPCVLSTGQTDVTIGKPTSVCLVVNGLPWVVGETEKYSQVLIIPNADDFSRFSVKGSWNSSSVDLDPILTTFGEEVGVHVESMGKYSFQKGFRLNGDLKTFPIHTAIITVDQGEVTGISWDDGCHFCGSSNCEKNTYDYNGGTLLADSGEDCFWLDSECNQEGTDSKVSALCQLTVYVVWTGTDAKGNYFTSFSKRLSMYADETVSNFIDDAADKYEDTIAPATDG